MATSQRMIIQNVSVSEREQERESVRERERNSFVVDVQKFIFIV